MFNDTADREWYTQRDEAAFISEKNESQAEKGE
jgi:hypothetical protein